MRGMISRLMMMRLGGVSTVAVAALAAIPADGRAYATTLSGQLTADNAFYAYISTNDSVLGTLVAEGNNWPSTFSLSNAALTPGQTNYLQIEDINYGGPGAFIGQFTLSDAGFVFANGSDTVLTETADWAGSYNNGNSGVSPQPWVEPTGATTSFASNGGGIWGGPEANISGSADWIWPTDGNSLPDPGSGYNGTCQYCTVDFSTPIYPSAVPEPSTIAPVGASLLSLGWFRRRHKTALKPRR